MADVSRRVVGASRKSVRTAGLLALLLAWTRHSGRFCWCTGDEFESTELQLMVHMHFLAHGVLFTRSGNMSSPWAVCCPHGRRSRGREIAGRRLQRQMLCPLCFAQRPPGWTPARCPSQAPRYPHHQWLGCRPGGPTHLWPTEPWAPVSLQLCMPEIHDEHAGDTALLP